MAVIAGATTSFGISGSLVFATGLNMLNLGSFILTSLTRISLFMTSLAAVI